MDGLLHFFDISNTPSPEVPLNWPSLPDSFTKGAGGGRQLSRHVETGGKNVAGANHRARVSRQGGDSKGETFGRRKVGKLLARQSTGSTAKLARESR